MGLGEWAVGGCRELNALLQAQAIGALAGHSLAVALSGRETRAAGLTHQGKLAHERPALARTVHSG